MTEVIASRESFDEAESFAVFGRQFMDRELKRMLEEVVEDGE